MQATIRYACALWLALLASSAVAGEPAMRVVDPLLRPALLTPRALHASLIGVAASGQRLVAVGERGVALFSADQGATWQQAAVPVSVTLTVVRLLDERRGWAAGHNGVLLQTLDGGASWRKVLDGHDVAALYQQQAERLLARYGEDDARARHALKQAHLLEADGPDKPWLDLHVDRHGQLWLVGAYGLMLHSTDGNQWQAWSARLDNPGDLHLYAIKSADEELVIAGEQGLLLRSSDGGQSFQRLPSPYRGSFFVLELSADDLLVGGLRGNVFRSRDHGQHFEALPLPAPVGVTASLRLQGGAVLIADQAGGLFRLVGNHFQAFEASAGPGAAALVETSRGELISVGRLGPRIVDLSSR